MISITINIPDKYGSLGKKPAELTKISRLNETYLK